MARTPRLGASVENERFRKLIGWLERDGYSLTAIANAIGCHPSYVNKLKNGKRTGGLGADIVRGVKRGLKVSADFFFDEEEPKDYKVYLLSEKRAERRVAVLSEQVADLTRKLDMLTTIVEINTEKPRRRKAGPRSA